jgi:hypothetical protein
MSSSKKTIIPGPKLTKLALAEIAGEEDDTARPSSARSVRSAATTASRVSQLGAKPKRKAAAKKQIDKVIMTPAEREWVKRPPTDLSTWLWSQKIGDLKLMLGLFKIDDPISCRDDAVAILFDKLVDLQPGEASSSSAPPVASLPTVEESSSSSSESIVEGGAQTKTAPPDDEVIMAP